MIDIGKQVFFYTLHDKHSFRTGVVAGYKDSKRGKWVVVLADDGKEYTTRPSLMVSVESLASHREFNREEQEAFVVTLNTPGVANANLADAFEKLRDFDEKELKERVDNAKEEAYSNVDQPFGSSVGGWVCRS